MKFCAVSGCFFVFDESSTKAVGVDDLIDPRIMHKLTPNRKPPLCKDDVCWWQAFIADRGGAGAGVSLFIIFCDKIINRLTEGLSITIISQKINTVLRNDT